MTKKIILTISILLVAILAVTVMIGCESYKNNSFALDSNDESISNGGSVVYHGDYVYFINGYSDLLDEYQENWFGNVEKGAIMRLKKDDTDMANVETIVPKAVYSTASNTGFSIYGDYIYYVTSSVTENRDGSVNSSTLEFMRTRTDGQETEILLSVDDGLSTQYKYTPNGILYVANSNVYFKSTEGKIKAKDAGIVVAEEISNAIFPVSESYKKGLDNIADYFLYTKASEDNSDYTNELYVSSANGEFNKKLIDKNTYTDKPQEDLKNAFSVSVIANKVVDGKLSIVYTKAYYASTDSTSTAAGTYMYTFDSASFDFDKAKERKVSTDSLSSLTIVDENTILSASGTLTSYTYSADSEYYVKKPFSTDYAKIESATVVGVHDNYVYIIVSNLFKRIKIDMSENLQTVGSDKVHVKFINPEIVVDGNNAYIYYFNDSNSQYLYRIDLGSYDKALQSADNIIMGYKTQADIEAEEKSDS